MPFDGNRWNDKKMFGFKETLDMIQQRWPDFTPIEDEPNATAKVSMVYLVTSVCVRIHLLRSIFDQFNTRESHTHKLYSLEYRIAS